MKISALGRGLVSSAIFALLSLFATGVCGPLVWAQSGAATKEQSGRHLDAAEERGLALGRELLARGIPGLAMAVAVDGKIVFSEGFGYADLEERAPVWPETKFRIGSISKPLTATAVVQLVAQGKLDLDAPIQKYVPSFPAKGATITSRMLAGHLGGIRHYQGDEFNIQKHYANVLESLKIFEDDPLVAPPGTQFNYSSYGYNLLSAAVESASGEEFPAYMQNQVFQPLSLRHTVADQNSRIIELRSRFYEQEKDKPLENAPYVDNSYKWAGGGFLSSAEDLVHFGSALLQPGFLNADSLALLFTSQKTKDGKETGYGIGWNVKKSKSGQRIYEHSGGSVGGHCQLILYPDSRVVVALVTNLSNAPWDIEEVESVAEAFANKTR
jgi:serine beta-lactamase-like protein LACTB, mitochondrial